jgi:hypothetical protein
LFLKLELHTVSIITWSKITRSLIDLINLTVLITRSNERVSFFLFGLKMNILRNSDVAIMCKEDHFLKFPSRTMCSVLFGYFLACRKIDHRCLYWSCIHKKLVLIKLQIKVKYNLTLERDLNIAFIVDQRFWRRLGRKKKDFNKIQLKNVLNLSKFLF